MSQRLLRVSQILTEKVRVGRSSFYSGVSRGLWPSPVRISARCSAWPEEEIDEILRARVAGASDAAIRHLVEDIHARRGRSYLSQPEGQRS